MGCVLVLSVVTPDDVKTTVLSDRKEHTVFAADLFQRCRRCVGYILKKSVLVLAGTERLTYVLNIIPASETNS